MVSKKWGTRRGAPGPNLEEQLNLDLRSLSVPSSKDTYMIALDKQSRMRHPKDALSSAGRLPLPYLSSNHDRRSASARGLAGSPGLSASLIPDLSVF